MTDYKIAKLTEEEIELWKLLKKYLLQNMFILKKRAIVSKLMWNVSKQF